jgi:hypothetical protein
LYHSALAVWRTSKGGGIIRVYTSLNCDDDYDDDDDDDDNNNNVDYENNFRNEMQHTLN